MRARRPPRGRQKRPSRTVRASAPPGQQVKEAERRVPVTLPARRTGPSAWSPTSARRTPVRRTPRCGSSPTRRGRLRRAAADARAGGASTTRRVARRGAGRARHGRGAPERARARSLLDGGDGAPVGRTPRPGRGAVGRRRRARVGVDASPPRGRLPRDPPARCARRAPARRPCVPGPRAEGLRPQAAARVRRREVAPLADEGNRRRRFLAPGGARARRRGQPPAPGPRRGPLRRDAALVAAGGDRPLPLGPGGRLRRYGRPWSRRQPSLRDAPLCGDDEVRRRGAARPPALGARPDRRHEPAASALSSAGTSASSPDSGGARRTRS